MQKLLFIVVLLYLSISLRPVYAQDKDIELAYEYYTNNELEKAASIYEKLVRREQNLAAVHKYYLDVLIRLKQYKDANKYLSRLLKKFPENPTYNVDYGLLFRQEGDTLACNKHLQHYLEDIKNDNSELRYAALYLSDKGLFQFAEMAYLFGKKNDKDGFYFELADLYSTWGRIDLMLDEYLQLLHQEPNQADYVQVILQDRVSSDEEYAFLERALVQYVQKYPDDIVYNEMLLWYLLQKKEFYRAFMQARAIDKRKKQEGFQILEIGKLALNNGDYTSAIKIFEYLVEKYRNQIVYPIAKRLLINSKEELVKNTYPVDIDKIRSLASDYEEIISELGLRPNTADALRSMALLQAFYLDNKDTAITILHRLIDHRSLPKEIVSKAKLDLGDINVLIDEPWEASLLYSQVEKAEKNTNLGHMAKLKNAKLTYYTGEFELAKAHLKILTLATDREIANDAMQLSLLIEDNLNLDTTNQTMEKYANIDLLVFQGKYQQALTQYDAMLAKYKGHSLTDEILWQKGNILVKLGKYEEALIQFKRVVEEFKYDILADDANFLIAKIYEENLNKAEEAMEYYKNQLIEFPGSVYNVEARKRFRKLRGDKI
ncbi:tetratricopeptide repeat protein [Rapidithrix thailandica]|uniref:Tetratricopeptide repeat protein n=1 Tax=Rapidithrix thailandica TaxID=413964 RepID=A0AAW9S5K5_9BACT